MTVDPDRPPFRADRAPEPAEIPRKAEDEVPTWTDDKKTVDRICYGLYALGALLLLIDPLVHKHGPFEIEHYVGFYGLYGGVVCVLLVLAARVLRRVLMRPEDYYDR
ncbi:MAG: hypothetical protein AAFV19_09775 [Pseudomonadota bacterium]